MFVKPTTALRLIDLGSAWYARCANESPSTTRSGRVIASRRVHRSRASGVRVAAGASAPGSNGSPYATFSFARRESRSVPLIAAGTSGAPARCAIRAAPECGRAVRVFRRPFFCRVPSGNIMTISPERTSSTAVSIASTSPSPRRTLNAPAPSSTSGERPPVELRLRHEAQPALREERQPDRPRVEVRHVVCSQDEARRSASARGRARRAGSTP